MNKVALGRTGLTVAPLVYGSLPLGSLQASLSPAEGGRLIRHALERGVNMVDTAHLYGTYAHLREGLRGFAGEVVVASKTHAATAAEARAHIEAALREIGREYLDVVHLHGARLPDPFVERADVFAELLRMRDEGKIGFVGLSTHYIRAVKAAASQPDIALVHPLINQTGMGILDGSAAEMAAAIAEAAGKGKGIYAMKALAGGNLIGQARQSLDFVRRLPGVHALAVGMLSEAEIEANIALFAGRAEEPERWRALEGQRRRLKIMDQFCKGCGACVDACTNEALELRAAKASLDESQCILCGYCAAACPDFIIRVI
ncbi:MAG: aldo/keto reductase [Alphaproteobacteria bacterium]|nr:aldo/keto reductase [Alphaproteobacteria bacterium]